MPFDTVERSNKRIRPDLSTPTADDDWYMQPTFEIINTKYQQEEQQQQQQQQYQQQGNWLKSYPFPPMDYVLPVTPAAMPIDIPYSNHHHLSPQSNTFWQDDNTSTSPVHRTSISSCAFSPITHHSSPPKPLVDSLPSDLVTKNPILTDVLSKVRFSYSDVGINLEAKISNASDLRSLIDAFSQLCTSSTTSSSSSSSCSSSTASNHELDPSKTMDNILLYRNKNNQTKPVNFFASTCRLGQIANPHSSLDSVTSLVQIADACIDTYFSCWVRFKPVLQKEKFMAWYRAQNNPTDTLIVNAICSYVFRHMIIHHPRNGFEHFLTDQDKLQEQEEYFFSRARECLSQSFDTPDRYTVVALLFMSIRAEPTKRHHYAGMAASALHELEIYPRMVNEDVDSYEKEMDTRLWWFAWAIDFSLWTAGSPKNTPQPRYPGQVDLPQVFEQDIDDTEIGVITFTQCLKLWQIQADIVAALYDQESSVLTVEQFKEYDKRLLNFYQSLPQYLLFDSGFEYGCEDLFLACLRVNIEYNATRIILHKLFIPELNDTRPSQAALDSLNVCLSTALTQLSAIKTCNMADVGRCAFDRDELWRAAEVISIAMSIYRTCVSPADQAKILNGIQMDDFMTGLLKSYTVLQNTREFRFSCKNWFQVADWIQVEIRRHQLEGTMHASHQNEPHKKKQPDYFLAHLKPNAKLNNHDPHPHEKSLSPPSLPQTPQMTASLLPKRIQKSQSLFKTNSVKSSFSTAPPFVQFNAYVPPDQQPQPTNGKSPARFRYFNPRKMNKFLFIDEHPMM
ncbi:uncharacterized protein B0P05DRAFT_562006 [Gilbertella persicaria]|uniref:uncharacterized protein n=1 Tax=Gilbertella persicaria TaxID=101096 RepID=UPI0022203177|nr:uncharacterized protein B0P05DRAFT_562006 [Gilbertella persicaria]KAI8052578.1 hypothetical protein B0P05DRAFT_562006 [Gilbertella persicaria]